MPDSRHAYAKGYRGGMNVSDFLVVTLSDASYKAARR